MATITRKWKKWAAATCSHGSDIDPKAREAFLTFLDRYNPHQRIHLGDAIDLACLRAGARRDPDDPDRAESLMDDLLAGLSFLHEMRPTMYFHGNHEARAVALTHSANLVVAYAAGAVMAKIQQSRKIQNRDHPLSRHGTRLGAVFGRHGFPAWRFV